MTDHEFKDSEAIEHSSDFSEELDKLFITIRESVFHDLDNGGDGCTSRVVNDAKYHVEELMNNKSIKLGGKVYVVR